MRVGRIPGERFTPTAVGNTYHKSALVLINNGSPPRLWGIRVTGKGDVSYNGSPPRLWGIHRSSSVTRRSQTVHPHGCGEYCVETLARNNCDRFTPTAVGNTNRVASRCPIHAVHPHGCGEYLRTVEPTSNMRGSPPRLWGIRSHARPNEGQSRFTPTPVGNTAI